MDTNHKDEKKIEIPLSDEERKMLNHVLLTLIREASGTVENSRRS